MSRPTLFVGVTAWNRALFLGRCLQALRATTAHPATHIMVWDNCSTDESAEIARAHGAEVRVQRSSQPEALNGLADASDAPFTLLLHADVLMVSPRWFEVCRERLRGNVALVSPEDIGCGPCTRPFGAGMPESSFMLFDTAQLHRLRAMFWRRWHRLPYPEWAIDFYAEHITHRLPRRLRDAGLSWQPMQVLVSPRSEEPIYRPAFDPPVWSPELSHLRYGLGNFYSLDGEITHYHNWYDRVPKTAGDESTATTGANGTGFPAAYVRKYTENLLLDWDARRLMLPDPCAPRRPPIAL